MVTLDFWNDNGKPKGYRVYERGFYKGFRVEKNSKNPETYRIFSGTYSENMDLLGTVEIFEKELKCDEFFAFVKTAGIARDYIRDLKSIDHSIYLEDLTLRSIHKDNLSAQIQ